MKSLLKHYFTPHEHNNHRAKLLHNSSLLIFVILFLFSSIGLQLLKKSNSAILGIAYSITENDLLSLTNKTRQEKGLNTLSINPTLSAAAYKKAQDMFVKDYWAHYSPDGTSPWFFIKGSGYNYLYAGENLAKGFSRSDDVVSAWMNSQSHRDNMLSDKYSDIGFAIVEGKLLGEDTVLIVEMFGSVYDSSTLARQTVNNNKLSYQLKNPSSEDSTPVQQETLAQQHIQSKSFVITSPVVDGENLPRTITFGFLATLMGVFLIDFVIIKRKKIFRLVGHNIDHMIMIALFLALIMLGRTGVVY